MPRPLRLFREYDFFGVLLPGLATVVFLYMLLPNDFEITPSAGIVFVGVFAFVFGQALHSIALGLETLPEAFPWWFAWSHRKRFEKELNQARSVDEETVTRFRRQVTRTQPDIEFRTGFDPGVYSSDEARRIYTYLRSYHGEEYSRAASIKPMYAFCRNSFVLFSGLIPVYWTYGFVDSSSEDLFLADLQWIDRPGKYTEYFPNYADFLEAAIPLATIGATIFLLGTVVYQRYYVEYVFADLLAARARKRQR